MNNSIPYIFCHNDEDNSFKKSDEDYLQIALKHFVEEKNYWSMKSLLNVYNNNSFLVVKCLCVALRRLIETQDFSGLCETLIDIDAEFVSLMDIKITVLHRFIKTGDFEGMKMFLLTFPNQSEITAIINDTSCYNVYYGSALHSAVQHHHLEECECFGSRNTCEKKIPRPNRKKIVEFLLENGANIYLEDYYNETPYEKAIRQCSINTNPATEVSGLVYFDKNITPSIKNPNITF